MKGNAYSDKLAQSYHPIVQLPSSIQRVSSLSLFWFSGQQLYCFGSVQLLSKTLIPAFFH